MATSMYSNSSSLRKLETDLGLLEAAASPPAMAMSNTVTVVMKTKLRHATRIKVKVQHLLRLKWMTLLQLKASFFSYLLQLREVIKDIIISLEVMQRDETKRTGKRDDIDYKGIIKSKFLCRLCRVAKKETA